MGFENDLPIWNKLTEAQKQTLSSVVEISGGKKPEALQDRQALREIVTERYPCA